MEKLFINTIYRATEGEGVFVGTPQIFVRFQGCNIGCVNCDSKNTWEFTEDSLEDLETVMDVIEMLAHKSLHPLKRVSITGGDPLHPKHYESLKNLIYELKKRNYWINLEAAGTRIVEDIFEMVDFISYDYKTPSTQVKTSIELLVKMHMDFSHKTQIKAVIANKEDFFAVKSAFNEVEKRIGPHLVAWVLTPCYETNEVFPLERTKLIQQLNEDNGAVFRVVSQQHKLLYGSNRLDV